MVSIYVSVSSVSGRIYTVKEIDTSFNSLNYVNRCSDTHKICRFILRQIRHNCLDYTIHFFMSLTNCQTAYGITIKVHFGYSLGMFDSYIIKYTTLIDTKKHLFVVYSIRQSIKPVHLLFTALKPPCSPVNRRLDIAPFRNRGRTLIKSHGDGRCKIGLNLHTLLRPHKYLSAVYMGIKINSLFLYLTKSGQGKHLKSTRICKYRLVP